MDRKYKEQTKSPHAPALSQVRVLLPACVRGAPLLRLPTGIHSGIASEPGGRTVHPPGVSCEGVTMTAGRVGPPAAPWGCVGGSRTSGSAMSGSWRVLAITLQVRHEPLVQGVEKAALLGSFAKLFAFVIGLQKCTGLFQHFFSKKGTCFSHVT